MNNRDFQWLEQSKPHWKLANWLVVHMLQTLNVDRHESASPCWAPLGRWPDYGSDPGLWSIHSGKPLSRELSTPLQKISMLFLLTFHFIYSSPYLSLRIPFSQPCYNSLIQANLFQCLILDGNHSSCLPNLSTLPDILSTPKCVFICLCL